MQKHITLVLAATTLFLAGCCTTHHIAKWEYKQLSSSMVTDETLNQLGDQGWSVVAYGSGFYILKRPKQ
jgi:hypothetical protein